MFYLLMAAIALGLGWYGWKMTSRDGYESAEYKVIQSDGSFEIREYPDLMLVTTVSEFNSQGNDGSFGRLFKYISGENESSSKVSMTTPVFMKPESEDSDGQMGFVLPSKVAESSIPNPSDESVEIERRDGGKFAVLRFPGQMNEKTKMLMEEKLRVWIEAESLTGSGKIEFAGYDPPWTPGPFRRNEVLIQVESM